MSGAVEAIFFDERYSAEPDPWGYRSSPYELAKFSRTLASLPTGGRCGAALEIGCANGELSARLADRCDSLLAFDYSAEAVRLAEGRAGGRAGVRIERRDLRDGIPVGPWELIVASEVLYYLTASDVEAFAGAVPASLAAGGSLLAVHWRGDDPQAPLDGGQVHEILRSRLDHDLDRVDTELHAGYVLDRWERPQAT